MDSGALIRRALIRQSLGRGGTATAARLAGVKTPTATINDPNAPHAISGTAQPLSGARRPRPTASPRSQPVPTTPPPAIGSADLALVNAATRLKFGGQEDSLNQALAQNARYTSGLKDWYANAMDQIRGIQAAASARSQQALQGIQGYASQAALANPTDQQAAAARNALQAQFADEASRGAAANSAAFDQLQGAYALQQGNAQNAANAARMQLLGQQGALHADEGAFKTTALNDLQGSRQTATLNAAKVNAQQLRDQAAIAVQQGNLQLAQQKLNQADRIYQNVTLPKAQAETAKTQAEVSFFNQHGYWPPTGAPKKGGSGSAGTFTRTQGETNAHHKIVLEVNNALEDVRHGQQQGLSPAAIRGAMQLQHIPNEVIDAATTLAGGGGLSNAQIKQLKLAGLIAAPRAWRPVKIKPIAPSKRPR